MNNQHPFQHPFQHPLLETFSDDRLEEWFAESGVIARVVDRCPLPGCSDCTAGESELERAA